MILKTIFLFTIIIAIFNSKYTQGDTTDTKYELPDLLTTEGGKTVQSVNDWEKIRRPEVLSSFEEYVYGKFPSNEINVKFEVTKEKENILSGTAILKEVTFSFSKGNKKSEMNLLIILPKGSRQPLPLFVGMNFYGNHTIHPSSNISITKNYVGNKTEFCITENRASHLSRGVRSNRWPVERIVERGYGLANIYYGDLDPDFHDEFKNGIHGVLNSGITKMGNSDGGAIAAWAYGLSKAMDYFETDDLIDQNRIAVIGHSRLGKTALWAGALDERFAVTISNNSGCGGAALSSRRMGETLKDINTVFPHWFCKNFHNYNERENDLPVDQHMLISLIAPRAVYIGSAVKDEWADPQGEYLSLYHSSKVFELYGQSPMTNESLPELNSPLIKGKRGYHIRSGRHDLTKYDWEKYMDFTDQILDVNK